MAGRFVYISSVSVCHCTIIKVGFRNSFLYVNRVDLHDANTKYKIHSFMYPFV
jgi:hypothetical protein